MFSLMPGSPRFLPEIRPTEFNYPIDIRGGWHGANYRFIQRYRSGHANNRGEEFDAPFTRLEYVGRDRFHISYHRHTGQWFRLYSGCTLAGALKLGASGRLRPKDVLVLTLTGHGLKDPDTAIANSEAAIKIAADPARLAAVLEVG